MADEIGDSRSSLPGRALPRLLQVPQGMPGQGHQDEEWPGLRR